jgi:hypothetical protein
MMQWLFWWRRKQLAGGKEPLRIEAPRDEAKTEIIPVVVAAAPVAVPDPIPEPALVAPPVVLPAAEPPPPPPPAPAVELAFPSAEISLEPPLSNEERFRYFLPDAYSAFSASSSKLIAPDSAFRAMFNRPRPAIAAPRTAPPAAPPPRHAPPTQAGIPLTRVATATSLPTGPPGNVACVDPILFSAYITSPGTIAETLYLTEPGLLERGIQLRDRVLRNWQSGAAPFTPEAFTEAGMQIAGHPGTALLLCHNVARAFARGGAAIRWENHNRARGEYFDGAKNWTAATIHRQGLVRPNALAPPSLFYLLFSARSFGVSDPGDWYRFFAIAAIATYTASRATVVPTAPTAEFAPAAQRLDSIAAAIGEANSGDAPPHRAMLWANAWTFHEWGAWGRTQDTADAAAQLAQRAVQFGLGATPPPWQWFVPRAGGLPPNVAVFSTDSVSRILTGVAGAAGAAG